MLDLAGENAEYRRVDPVFAATNAMSDLWVLKPNDRAAAPL